MIDFFSGLLTPIIAILAAYIAWQQWRTNNLRLKHELFDRRYDLYVKITSYLATSLTTGRIEPNSEMQFLRDTKAVDFLFDKQIHDFVHEIYSNAVKLYTLNTMENRLTGQALHDNVDGQRKIKDWFSEQLGGCTDRFAKYLSLGGRRIINERQRTLLWWFIVGVCLLMATIVGILAFGGFHHIAAGQGDVFDAVVYKNHLRWIVPLLVVLFGLLLIGVVGFIGFWFVLREKLESRR
jgi:hypothetical protein